VPPGSIVDRTDVIERQIERFAPSFRDRILARHATSTTDLERENPNYVGGAITGGVADIFQFFTRPVARPDPYSPRTRASSSARRRLRRGAGSTGCAATSPHGARGGGWSASHLR
jgi:phytoene dehydrogenase-like protein